MSEYDVHFLRSSYREMLLEHLLAGEIMKHLWLAGHSSLEILKPLVDDSGYDIVLESGNIVRHVQLKASFRGSTIRQFNISRNLSTKPSGCVVCIRFDRDTLELGPFSFFGRAPGEPLPDLTQFKTTRHSKGNAQGIKNLRPNLRSVPLSQFEVVATIPELVERLFGPAPV